LALSRKTGRFTKYWRLAEKQADDRILAGVEIPAPGEKTSGTGKYWRPAYCLGSAESPAADFLLDWLKSSHSDPRRCLASLSCRPQVRTQPRLPCFYGRTLPRTVPAACTGPTCQNSRGSQNFRRPRKFSLIPVKSQESYLGF
jgi:hypothetical protein